MLKLLLIHLSLVVGGAWGACDICHTTNPIACHGERKYSLCINGVPTYDFIYCPINYVCTAERKICVAENQAEPSCPTTGVKNRCGICNIRSQVFSCLNETTIAFCFGRSSPDPQALAYCPHKTVCDLENENEFCSYEDKAEPSCKEDISTTTTTTDRPPSTAETTTTTATTVTTKTPDPPTTPTTTQSPTTTTTPKPTTTTTPKPTTTTTTPQPTTTTTPKPTTTTTTPQPTTTTPKPTTTTTTTPKPTTTTPKPTTTTTTPKPTTTTPKPTTTTAATTTTTASPTPLPGESPSAFCQRIKKGGSHKTDAQNECKTFIVCTDIGNVWYGTAKTCNPGEYFNETTEKCGPNKPANCISTI